MRLSDLYKQVINESVSRDKIISAIENKDLIRVTYDNEATGPRTIQVYALGDSKAGNPVIRVYQPFGDTETEIPTWKTFRLDRIMTWVVLNKKFYKPISDYDSSIPSFNPSGDDTMRTIYKIAKF
jgi:hypothetical protein